MLLGGDRASAVRALVTGRAPGWPADREQARWDLPAVVICLLAAQVLALLWAGYVAIGLYGSETPLDLDSRPIWVLLASNLGLWVAYFVGPIMVKRLTGSGPMVDFDLRARAGEILLAVVIGVGYNLAVLPALYWFVVRVMSGDPSASAEALGDRINNGLDAVLFLIAVVIVAPIVEEWFYRGLVLSTMARRFGLAGAAVGSAAVFALVHWEAILLPGLFGLALLLAWLTIRTGRIGPAVVAHMAFNATTAVQLLAF